MAEKQLHLSNDDFPRSNRANNRIMNFFDTHFHLPESGDCADYLAPLPCEHEFRLMAIGGALESSRRAAEFAAAHCRVWSACGVHPHEAEGFDGDLSGFADLLAGGAKIRAVGEIGLDFFYEFAPRARQRDCFAAFLTLALERNLPAVVHCRDQAERKDAYLECYAMLKDFAAAGGRFILHCYAGDGNDLEKFLALGGYIGLTGMVTFPKSANIRAILRQIPDDRLLLETDAPYLAPVPFRGQANHPGLLPVIAEFVARERGMRMEDLAALTVSNGLRAFGIAETEE